MIKKLLLTLALLFASNVAIAQVPTVTFNATPGGIITGASSTLSWSSTNATSCTGSGFSTGSTTSGTASVSPTALTLYSVSCTGTGGTTATQVYVAVSSGVPLATTPQIIQGVASATNDPSGETGQDFVFSLPNPTQGNVGDALVLGIMFNHGITTTVSDPVNGTWPAACVTADGGSGEFGVKIFVFPNTGALASNTRIKVHGSSAWAPFAYRILEVSDIAKTSPCNGTLSTPNITINGSGLIDPGSFTPGNNNANGGNFIFSFFHGAVEITSGGLTSWSNASNYTLFDADITNNSYDNHASETYLQTTSAATDPSFTGNGYPNSTDVFNLAAVALKVAPGSGVVPSGIYIRKIIHYTWSNQHSANTAPGQFPSIGNLHVIANTASTANNDLTSITDNLSNTWTTIIDDSGGSAQYFLMGGQAINNSNLMITTHYNSTGWSQYSSRYYDIQGATSTNADVHNGGDGACTQTITNTPAITPTFSPGLVLGQIGLGTGPGLTLTSPIGGIDDLVHYTGQSDTSQIDNSDLVGHYYNSNLNIVNFSWTATEADSDCEWEAITLH